jgi:hypothetical protein
MTDSVLAPADASKTREQRPRSEIFATTLRGLTREFVSIDILGVTGETLEGVKSYSLLFLSITG